MKQTIYYCLIWFSLFLFGPAGTLGAQSQNTTIQTDKVKSEVAQIPSPFSFVKSVASASLKNSPFTHYNELKINKTALAQIAAQSPKNLEFSFLNSSDEFITISLERNNILSEDFVIGLNDKGEANAGIDLGVHYSGHGTINGKKVVCAFSFFKDNIEGVILDKIESSINFTSLRTPQSEEMISYKTSDIRGEDSPGCGVYDNNPIPYSKYQLEEPLQTREAKCTQIWWESNYNVYQYQGNSLQNTIIFNLTLFNAYHAIYMNESIKVLLHHLEVWTSVSPYPDPSDPMVDDRDETLAFFQAGRGATFTGDLAGLVTQINMGGVAAGFSGLCNATRNNSMCIIGLSGGGVGTYPNFAFNVYISAHEFGHLFGSRHTHACVWNGNSTAIDGCAGYVEGGCPLPGSPAGGGTMMSYCWNTVGIDFTQGFGPQPGAVIRNSVNNAVCVTACCAGGFTPVITYVPVPLCEGSYLVLSSSPPGQVYSWTGPNSYKFAGSNPEIANVSAINSGIYYLTVTNSEGCIATTSLNITVFPIPIAGASGNPNPICVGRTLTLNATGGTTYSWSGPAGFISNLQSPIINNMQLNQGGVYTVTVSNAGGCTDIANVNVVVNALPNATASASPNPICAGQNLSLFSSGGTSYNWSGPNFFTSNMQSPVLNSIQSVNAGIYTVTVTSAAGCTSTSSVNVVVNPNPIATASASPNPICVGKTLSLTSSGGTSYSWSGPAAYSSNLQNPSIVNIQLTQDGIYTVTVTNANGCTSTATVDVTVNPLPNATASVSPNPICAGELAWFTADGGVAYKWSGPNGFNTEGKQFGLHMAPNMAGTYYVTVTNSNGCSKSASVSITVNPAPNATASVSPNPACSGQTIQFASSGGTTYKWTGPAGFSSNQQNPVINNAQQYHSGEYSVVVTNSFGCKKTVTVAIKVNQSPAGQISYDNQSTCTGSTLQLYASGGSTYQWNGPAGFTSSLQNPTRPNANSTYSGNYSVIITNIFGCSVTMSVNITIRPLPVISAYTTTPEVCEGGTALLYANGGTSYSWSGPYGYASNFQNPIIINIPTYLTGTYTVTGSNQYGCTAKANVFITVQSVTAIVNATPNPVPYGGTLYLTASGGTSYQWTGPDGFHTTQQNPIIIKFSKVKEGLYSCIVSSSAGCQDTKIILVQVKSNGFSDPEFVTKQIEGTYKQVYPNPASTSIQLEGSFEGLSEYQILNGQGQIVMSGKSSAGEQIQISSLAPGAYYIHWIYQNDTDNKVSNISRFVKTN